MKRSAVDVPLPAGLQVRRDAWLSPDGRYRYTLWRRWGDTGGSARIGFVMLNPSTADGTQDDPTVRRCISYARKAGFDELIIANLFALRSPSPSDVELALKRGEDAIGPQNAQALRLVRDTCGVVIAAWGNGGKFRKDLREVCASLDPLMCLDVTKSGMPAHPLYLKDDLPFIEWRYGEQRTLDC